jgi:SNF2 family DNA or RNA helicase
VAASIRTCLLLPPIQSHAQGLGKTLQAIALVAALLGKTGDQRDLLPAGRRAGGGGAGGTALLPGCPRWPLLVVAPSSVLDNWQREFQRWGNFRVGVTRGVGGVGWSGG